MIEIDINELKQTGFTESGATRFVNTIKEYSSLLFEKSRKLGEARKANDSNVEINYENVQAATKIITESFGISQEPKWKIWVQAGEYIFTAACGYLGSQATQVNAPSYFIILFVLSAIFGVCLFITRKTAKK